MYLFTKDIVIVFMLKLLYFNKFSIQENIKLLLVLLLLLFLVEILQLQAMFKPTMVPCSRFPGITNFGEHRRV